MKKTRFWTFFGLFALFLLVFVPAQAQQGGNPLSISYVAVQESESRLDLNVFFTVRDANGEPIPNPSINEATIQLLGTNSEPVQANVNKPNTPIYIVLLIDGSGSMQALMPDVRVAARAAIDQAPPNALFSVIQFNEGVTVIEDFTDNHERVKAAINLVQSEDKGTCLYDAAFDAIGRLDRAITSPQEQRAIILFTDGKDQLTTNDPTPCSVQTLPDVIRAARPTDITRPSTPIHTIGLYGQAGDNSINQPALQQLAGETYAFSAFGTATQLDSLFERIMQGLNSQLVATASVFAQQGVNQAILSISDRRDGLPQTAPFTFAANFPHDAPPDAITAIDNGVDINEQLLSFSVGLSNAEQIDRLLVRVEDEGGIRALDDDIIVAQPGNAVVIEIDVTDFEVEEPYTIQVFALDENGGYILNAEDEVLLLAREFTKSPPDETAFEFEIDAVNVEYELGQLIIDLDVPDADMVQSYAGYISDSEAGSKLYEFEPTIFTEERIVRPLPEFLVSIAEQRDYELTLVLEIFDQINGELKEIETVREFSPIPPPRIGRIAGFVNRLRANPYILYAIIGVFLLMFLLISRRNKKAKEKIVPVVRPPVENKTVLFNDPIFQDLQRRDDEEGFDSVVSPSGAAKGTALPMPTEGHSSQKAKVKVLRMPKEQVLDSRVFNMFPLTVGREQADVVVREDPYISRQHVEIGVDNGSFYVKDLESKSGVRIDGERIAVGEKVKIGRKTRVKLSSKTTLEITTAQ